MNQENRESDELIEYIGQCVNRDEEKPGILNPLRLHQIRFAHRVLEWLLSGTDMEVSATLNEPCKSMGSICVEGDYLEFTDCKWFARAIEFASNVEMYPTSNEKIRLVLTFHALTVPIDAK